MARQTAEVLTDDVQGYQEGSRWYNKAPSGDELAKWFKANVKLHEGLDHADYVQGITLIPQQEKVRKAVMTAEGPDVVDAGFQLVFTPYAKVETRIAYFWDYVALLTSQGHDVVGAIEPAPARKITGDGPLANEHLPDGFFRFPIQKEDGRWASYLGCSMQVRIYERDVRAGGPGRDLIRPAAGTKISSLTTKYGEDANVIMKAETGAVGRALGMAGMLVIPGSGIATAEDMHEALSQAPLGGGSDAAPPAALPAEAPTQGAQATQGVQAAQEGPIERAQELISTLQADFPDKFEEVREWAKGRKIVFSELEEGSQLRGVVRKLEKALAEAQAQADEPEEETKPESAVEG